MNKETKKIPGALIAIVAVVVAVEVAVDVDVDSVDGVE